MEIKSLHERAVSPYFTFSQTKKNKKMEGRRLVEFLQSDHDVIVQHGISDNVGVWHSYGIENGVQVIKNRQSQ